MASAPQVAQQHDYPEVYRTQPYVTNSAKDYSHNNEDVRPTHATVLGLRRRNFWILLVLAIVLVGATIGGSVGGSLAVRKDDGKSSPSLASSSSSSSSPTPAQSTTPTQTQSSTSSSSTYVAPPFSELRYINGTCPSPVLKSGGDAPDLSNEAFSYDCEDGTNIPTLPDLMSFGAYTLQQCVDACSQYNDLMKNKTCLAVTLGTNIAHASTTGNGANCWLKGSTAKRETKQTYVTSAFLRS